ncbi:hypothetical protein FOZ63_016901, partial [Perkinsus olseni]
AALALTLPFDETKMLEDQKGLIKKQLGLPGEVEVRDAAEESSVDKNNRRATGAPGRAVIVFYAKDNATQRPSCLNAVFLVLCLCLGGGQQLRHLAEEGEVTPD